MTNNTASCSSKSTNPGRSPIKRLLCASLVTLGVTALPSGTALAATAARQAFNTKAAPGGGGTSCILGKWVLAYEEITISGKPFARGGGSATVTFTKAAGFTSASGPMKYLVDFDGSSWVDFFGGMIRTKTTGMTSAWVLVSGKRLIPDGHISENTSQTEEIDLGGKWIPTKPPTGTSSQSPPPAIKASVAWKFTCVGVSLQLAYDVTATIKGITATSGFEWVLIREGAGTKP